MKTVHITAAQAIKLMENGFKRLGWMMGAACKGGTVRYSVEPEGCKVIVARHLEQNDSQSCYRIQLGGPAVDVDKTLARIK